MLRVLQLTRILTARSEIPTVSGVRVRNFSGTADIAAWLAIRRIAFADQLRGVRDWTTDDFRAEFTDHPAWRPEWFWMAEEQRRDIATPIPVGAISLMWRGPDHSRPAVHWMAVLPRCRRRGIGELLLATLEAAVWDAGHRQIWLETHGSWQAAVAFYQAAGYRDARANAKRGQ